MQFLLYKVGADQRSPFLTISDKLLLVFVLINNVLLIRVNKLYLDIDAKPRSSVFFGKAYPYTFRVEQSEQEDIKRIVVEYMLKVCGRFQRNVLHPC